MLRKVLLFCAVAGLQARPLQNDPLRFQNGGWILNVPQMVQDQYMYEPEWEVVLTPDNEAKFQDNPSWRSAPIEERRQGTEPSRRFLIDLDTGMLKEHSSEMDRRVSGFYNYPSNYEFRQGTQNSQATLVDISTGQLLPHHSEMQRSTAPLDEYSPATLMTLRKAQIDMESTDSVAIDTTHEVAPPELQKQGTEPSRRFLMDLNTGMLKERRSEMDRRVSGFYNYPSNYEFRQGTQDSQVTLIDLRTGQQLEPLSEMQRRAALAVSEDGQSTVQSQGISKELQNNHIVENNEVEAQSMHLYQPKPLENNEVIISSVIEGPFHPKEFRHGMKNNHANIISNHIMKLAETRKSGGEGVAICQGMIIHGKCYHLSPNA